MISDTVLRCNYKVSVNISTLDDGDRDSLRNPAYELRFHMADHVNRLHFSSKFMVH
jgi:hypothetical protein